MTEKYLKLLKKVTVPCSSACVGDDTAPEAQKTIKSNNPTKNVFENIFILSSLSTLLLDSQFTSELTVIFCG